MEGEISLKINVLTADVYNKIAAGEVVDRPYSVVKELVENAIDAGATQITVEIMRGGKQRVRVTDNGGGISREDLPLAYCAHATSKLKTASDLFCISTLGFRGEALASVAAVSRMDVCSRTETGDAYSLTCQGGVLGEVLPSAGAKGTVVTVDDLFYNVPARLKFLKSDTQEEADISGVMARFLLSHPEISFTYLADEKVKYRSFGDGLSAALAAVYGAGVLENCIEICAEKHGIKIHGFIGNRNYYKANRTYQSLFVNGRYVVNQTVGAALTNAYASYLMKRQYPFYVLFVDVPPEVVDVNVHPNKADVRFADNQIIYGCVYTVISAVLDGNAKALEYLVTSEKSVAAEEQKREQIGLFADVSDGKASGSEQSSLAVPPRNNTIADPVVPQYGRGKTHPAAQMNYAEAKEELKFDLSMPNGNEPRFFSSGKTKMEVRQPVTVPETDVFAENKRLLEQQETARIGRRIEPKSLVYKGELFQTYLIYESGDCAYFIDQHAAHERILYDKLKEKWDNRTVVSQPMLLPFVLGLNTQEFAFLEKNFTVLRELGFEIEEFGDDCVRVSALPIELMGMDLDGFFKEVLSSMESLRAIKLTDILKDKLATSACKAAVKGGEKLTESEARSLVERMGGDIEMKCPHGRPAVVTMKKSDLEKLFKRIV